MTHDFAALLGLAAGELAAVVGMDPPAGEASLHPRRADLAGLARDARRLNGEQPSRAMELI